MQDILKIHESCILNKHPGKLHIQIPFCKQLGITEGSYLFKYPSRDNKGTDEFKISYVS